MIESRLFDYDPLTGVTEVFHYDTVTDEVTMELTQTLVVDDLNAAQANAVSDYAPERWKGDLHHVARVPLVVLEELRKNGILDDGKALRRWLNDRDNQVFRTKPGRL